MNDKQSNVVFSEVGKTYKKHLFQASSTALDDLSFEVHTGEIFGIIGPNGAGKSTALKILLGFMRQDKGTVSIHQKSPLDSSSHAGLGYLPENPCLYDQLTITEHLRFAGQVSGYSPSRTEERISELLTRVDLDHVAQTPIRSFSKGMTQRAALAYALFSEPELLILDEPMSGLDPLGRQMVVDILQEYNRKGHTVLFCSHILTDVERICNRIAIMNRGRLATIIEAKELSPADSVRGHGKTPLEELFFRTIAGGGVTS
jgi:ABC-2 type transport system ATP-binding protein